jgi:hypothetical protein
MRHISVLFSSLPRYLQTASALENDLLVGPFFDKASLLISPSRFFNTGNFSVAEMVISATRPQTNCVWLWV